MVSGYDVQSLPSVRIAGLCCQMPLMQEAVPSAVIAAVMMLAINWRIALHVSLLFIFF
jgi:hypothetical protein